MDTTAKVDIRRLQLLNDRIAQTIEALNQVRLSVHGLGLSHTAGNVPGFGLGNVGGNVGLGFGGLPFQGGVPYGFQGGVPYGLQGGNIGLNPGFLPPGIQHSSPFGYGFPQHLPQAVAGGWPVQNGIWGNQNIGGFGGGLNHTSPEVLDFQNRALGLGLDPYTVARIIQSFPFAQSAVPGLY